VKDIMILVCSEDENKTSNIINNMNQKEKNYKELLQEGNIGIVLCSGITIGSVIGVSFNYDLSTCVSLGVVFGLIFGIIMKRRNSIKEE